MTQHVQQAADGVGALVAEALDFYRVGKLDEAEQRCAAVLEADENNVRILSLFGTMHAMRGRCEEAVQLIGRSLTLNPRQPVALTTMGNALAALKRHQEAADAYEKAIALKPTLESAYRNLGRSLVDLGRADEAIAHFDKALALEPNSVEALVGKGNALRKLHRQVEALPYFDRAIEINPDFADAHSGRAGTLHALNRLSESADAYDKAIALKPNDAELYKAAGDLCGALQRFDAAAQLFENATLLRPDYAIAYWRRAYALRCLKRLDEALECIEKAFELDPAISVAGGERLTIKMSMCHWKGLSENINDAIEGVERGRIGSYPFPLLPTSCSPENLLKSARIYASGLKFKSSPIPVSDKVPDRLRVAYISADYRTHPVARHIAGLIESHDPTRFETVGVCLAGEADLKIRTRLKSAFETFVLVDKMSDDEAAAMLREMDIHIAVDLMAFTRNSRSGILARRVAPIQINYLGYAGTMGSPFIDYIIADQTVIPPQEHSAYTEKVVYMPHTYMPSGRGQVIGETTRAEHGLPENGFVFCSLSNSYKITPQVFDVWMRLLAAVEDSVLWLSLSNASMIGNLEAEARARGIDPSRLIFASPVRETEEHMGRLRLADLFLDTIPYNSHSTACEALWSGVPVLTCLGHAFQGRVAASVLRALGLPEMVTYSLPEYEARALEIARDPSARAALREKLWRNRRTQPLFDTIRYTRNLEAAYSRMWDQHQRGEPAVSFAVDDVKAA
jgi:predicted O-linked N-acetylglucosamine transferase (SPINDLY family)